jgi:raffinose/stachyose/melibiose transport system permease protein
MKGRKFIARNWSDGVTLIVLGIVFIVPFAYILLTAAKTRQEASLFSFSWPGHFQLIENIRNVIIYGNYTVLRAMWNSTFITLSSITLIVLFSALAAFVMQRRRDRAASIAGSVMLAGLIIPPAVVPTIFLMQWLGIYKTLFSMIMIEVAVSMPYALIVLRAFMASIPSEIDEAAIMDGASPFQLFFSIILPLLQPAIITVIVTSSVAIYNDFTGPLYFLPGNQNVTAQLTLYNFMSQFSSQWNMLFADVIIITIPPLILFMFFQQQIVSGMTTGAIKG